MKKTNPKRILEGLSWKVDGIILGKNLGGILRRFKKTEEFMKSFLTESLEKCLNFSNEISNGIPKEISEKITREIFKVIHAGFFKTSF